MLDVVTLQSDRVEVECVPGHGGRILTLRDRRTGRNWLNGRRESDGKIRLPESGIEVYSGWRFQSPGWGEPFDVVERADDRLVMRTRLPSGLTIERRVEVAGPVVRMRDSLRNVRDSAQEVTLRIHPSLDVTDSESTRIAVKTAGNTERTFDLPRPTGGAPGGEMYFRGPQWALVDHRPDGAGGRLTHRVRAGDVEKFYAYYDPADAWVTMELWSAKDMLAPAQEVAIEHEYDVGP